MNEFVLALLKCSKIGNTKAYEFIKQNKFDINNMKTNLKDFIGESEFQKFDDYKQDAANEIERNKVAGISIITIMDDRFPAKLFTISDPVLYLYYKGNIDLINSKSVAVIGTRHPKEESIMYTNEVTSLIVKKGYSIVGGLALGIDTVGHQSAINNGGKTIAVMPTGLDNIQPISNKKLADEILKHNGCLVSEYSVGTIINTFNYAKRDRIQAALSNAIFVGEATEKSGTIIAVNKAIQEKKYVFQLDTNNNSIIKNTISSNYDNIEDLFSAVEINSKIEINRKKIIDTKIGKQISLF